MDGLYITLSDELVTSVLERVAERQLAAKIQARPEPDEWLTIPEAATHAHMTEGHMRLLVLGRPYRAAANGKAERPAVVPKIPRGDTGFAKGARVRKSAVDAYLTRHSYRS